MKVTKALILVAFCLSFLSAEEEIQLLDLETLLTPADRLEYDNYRVLRSCEFKEDVVCKYVVKKNGINLVYFPEDSSGLGNGVVLGDEKGKLHPDFLKTGLVLLLAKKIPESRPVFKNITEEVTGEGLVTTISAITSERAVPVKPPHAEELIFESCSGGVSGSIEYTIYTHDPDFKEIFDSYAWSTGFGLSSFDIDKDGTRELIQTSSKYDFAFGRPHIDSAFPQVIFKYNEIKKEYLPANRQFKQYILSELKKIVPTIVDDEKDPCMSPLLMHVLTCLYLGMDKEAWEIYNKYYKLKNKDALKKDILTVLSKDPVFCYLSSKSK
ncbi:MAG: hypothetical protein A2231_07060 [Candidatus Firestonebacteria bacterium RIFOXYA2_FULL_40_8]|nr:MAG: hypothetical protein A2231_07060 [Candidatus Firestonebacteria bacterium RIFOXYA2_FULL_40_8]